MTIKEYYYEIIRDDGIGLEGKYAIMKKSRKGESWSVNEVEAGFNSSESDKPLQEMIETYWYSKNLCEFSDLENDLHKDNEIMDAMAKDLHELHWHWSDH